MKRPERVRILGKRFAVQYIAGAPLADDENGLCDSDEQTIYIREGLKPAQERSVLLHEIVHAVSDLMTAGLTEKQVLGLETGLFALLSDNPSLFTYLRTNARAKV